MAVRFFCLSGLAVLTASEYGLCGAGSHSAQVSADVGGYQAGSAHCRSSWGFGAIVPKVNGAAHCQSLLRTAVQPRRISRFS